MKTSSSINVFIPGVLMQSTEFPNTVRLYVCATLNIWVWCTHKEHSDYEINSNEESGLGRFDILIAPLLDPKKLGIIIEIKSLSKDKGEEVPEKIQKAAEEAIQQIQDRRYNATLAQKGLKKCLNIGIAFSGKEFAIAHGFEELRAPWA